MSKDDSVLTLDWEVVEVLWWWKYKVVISWMEGVEVEVYTSWKMKKNNIKIIVWDVVQVELNPYDMRKWRIIFRSLWWKKRQIDENKIENIG